MENSQNYDLIIRQGTIFQSDPQDTSLIQEKIADIAILKGKIVKIEDSIAEKIDNEINAEGLHVLPGIIDSQVHFRDPGAPQKEDFSSGTKSAILGGVTAVFDMPNTKPNTSTKERYLEKLEIVKPKAYCDFALFVGATNTNSQELATLENLEGCCGIKIFMGSSTGDLLVSEDEFLEKVLRSGKKTIAVHCEDEETLIARKHIAEEKAHPVAHPDWRSTESALKATQRIVSLANKVGRKIHTLHITTADEMEFLKKNKKNVTVEILPQHMFFSSPDCYEKLGTYAQMNPPIRSREHQEAIKKALQDGVVDVIGSDHAPHTKEEKDQTYPLSPSGLPGVQTIVPIMLNFVNQGLLSLEHFIKLMSINPARIYKAKGKGGTFVNQDADFTIVDMSRKETITNEMMASRCGWTPYNGVEVKGWPVMTVIRGQIVMKDGAALKKLGAPIQF